MSILRATDLNCPSCETSVTFDLVHSVNADRRPDLRDAILDRSFQMQPCPACGHTFRVEPEFSYMDMRRGQFLAVWPSDGVDRLADYEARSRVAYELGYGAKAPPEARAIGDLLTPRLVFGWIALNEKLIASEAGVDDVLLELAKLAVIRTSDTVPLGTHHELRLLGVDGTDLVMGWFRVGSEDLDEVVSVSKDLVTEIETDAEKWSAMREELSQGFFVDYRRFFVNEAVTG